MGSLSRGSLALLNVLGGIAVLGSYALAFDLPEHVQRGLWGGVPDALQPVYTVSMLSAAIGYFPMTGLFVLGREAGVTSADATARLRSLHALYALVLVPSALWLPMTAHMIEAPSLPLWWAIRLVLALVGLGALGLARRAFLHARASAEGVSALRRWAPFAGSIAFCLQTAFFDGLLWPALFPLDGAA